MTTSTDPGFVETAMVLADALAKLYDEPCRGGPVAVDKLRNKARTALRTHLESRPAPEVQEGEPDMRHPKIQALLSAKARHEIELSMVEDLLNDPEHDFSAMSMEYWGPLHDKAKAVSRLAARPARAPELEEGATLPTPEMIRAGLREMFNGNRDAAAPWGDVISRVYRSMRDREQSNVARPTPASSQNQCDGCMQGAPMRGNLHVDKDGRAFMTCEREKYAAAPASHQGDISKEIPIEMMESFLRNCLIIPRDGDKTLFREINGVIMCRLDGYAVIPMDEYRIASHQVVADHIGDANKMAPRWRHVDCSPHEGYFERHPDGHWVLWKDVAGLASHSDNRWKRIAESLMDAKNIGKRADAISKKYELDDASPPAPTLRRALEALEYSRRWVDAPYGTAKVDAAISLLRADETGKQGGEG